MLTEVQTRKLSRLFQQTDYNNDGFVERADYEQLGGRISHYLGLQPGSAEDVSVRTRYLGFWNDLQQMAGKGSDGKLNEAEYVAVYASILSHEGYFEPLLKSVTNDILEWEDRDRDGKISRQEYVGFMQVYDLASEDAEQAFQRLDRDRDGYLVREELLQAVEEFFLSSDPEARGNWLLGSF